MGCCCYLAPVSLSLRKVRIKVNLILGGILLRAIFLINESFQSWSESPIKTMVETIPIIELKYIIYQASCILASLKNYSFYQERFNSNVRYLPQY